MAKPKKVTSWRVCPECGGRAQKIVDISTGKIKCHRCMAWYDPPELNLAAKHNDCDCMSCLPWTY